MTKHQEHKTIDPSMETNGNQITVNESTSLCAQIWKLLLTGWNKTNSKKKRRWKTTNALETTHVHHVNLRAVYGGPLKYLEAINILGIPLLSFIRSTWMHLPLGNFLGGKVPWNETSHTTPPIEVPGITGVQACVQYPPQAKPSRLPHFAPKVGPPSYVCWFVNPIGYSWTTIKYEKLSLC